MIGLMVTVLVLTAFWQADGRSIGKEQSTNNVLRETMEQSFSCAMQMGPKARTIPRIHGLEELPEDNDSLNELWGCIFVKKGLIDHANKINAEKLRVYLMDMFTILVEADDELRQMADEITQSCQHVEADHYQLKSIRLQNCINYSVKEKAGV